MTLLAKMDRLVYATGLDRIIFLKVQPRTFRWIPLFVIAVLVAGYAVMANAGNPPNRRFLLGWALFYAAYLFAAFLRIFGPRFAGTALNPIDERELMVKARAYAISGVLLTSFAMLGCFYIGSAELLRLWRPHTLNDWIGLGFGIQAAAMLLPTLIASWMQPRPAGDSDN